MLRSRRRRVLAMLAGIAGALLVTVGIAGAADSSGYVALCVGTSPGQLSGPTPNGTCPGHASLVSVASKQVTDGLASSISQNSQQLTSLQSEVKTLEAQVQALQSSSSQQEIDTLKQQVQNLQGQLTAVNQGLTYVIDSNQSYDAREIGRLGIGLNAITQAFSWTMNNNHIPITWGPCIPGETC